jgi:iron complex outermembrane recepter protein
MKLEKLITRIVGCLAVGLAQMGAQTAGSVRATPGEEVVKLSDFTVNSNTDRGYVASESMSGSRVATQINDLPFSVNVITSEFMNDFGFLEANDQFAYTSSVNNVNFSDGGSYNMRGFGSQYMLRDGFFRVGMTDPILIDRVEFIKGPNASIYGEIQPGGMINIITKRPTMTPKAKMNLTFGSYGTDREDFVASGPASSLGKSYFLVAGSDYERHYEEKGPTLRNRSLGLGFEHKFSAGGDLYVIASYMRNQSHTVMSSVPYYYNSQTKTYTGIAMNLAKLNENGPQSENSRDVSDVTATFDQRLNRVFSVRASANWFHRHKWSFNAGNGQQYDYLNNVIARGTPAMGLIGEDGGGVQVDLLAQYKIFNDKVANKTLLTFDLSDYYRFDPTWNLNGSYIVANTATTPPRGPAGTYWFRNIFPGQPIDYSVPAFDPNTTYNSISRYDKNRATIWGGLLRQQMDLFKGRLLLFGMLRNDVAKFNLHSYRSSSATTLVNGVVLKASATAWSPAIGLNYKLTPKTVSLYVSRSNGFNANAQNQNALNGNTPNERSWGYDYGLKLDLLQDRLFMTFGGYYIVRRNVADTELLPNGTTVASFTGSQLARGFETDFTFRATDNFTLLGGYGHNNTIYTYLGRDTGAIGYSPAIVPHDNFGVAAKYAFTGSLKGLSTNLGVTYVGSVASQNPNTGDQFAVAAAGGGYTGNDGRRFLMLPGYTLVNLNLHYRFHLGANKRFTNTVSVSLPNLGNRVYIRNTFQVAADQRAVYFSYGIGY